MLANSISCSPPAELIWTQDVFGNVIATATFTDATADLAIISETTVEQSSVAWPVFRIGTGAHSFPFEYSADEVTDLGALRLPEQTDPAGNLRAWVQAFVRSAVQHQRLRC